MKTATFYIIEESAPQNSEQSLLEYALFLARHFAKQDAKVYLHAQNKQQAEQLDEICFAQSLDEFIPHNLVGEGPRFGCPLEIGYLNEKSPIRPHYTRNLVINLANSTTNFAESFAQVVDFVPSEKKAKQDARERYKIYRNNGFQMQTITLN